MTQPFDLTIDVASRQVLLRTRRLSMESPWPQTQELLSRLLTSPAVESIVLDRRKATAILHLADAEGDAKGWLTSIADALRAPAVPRLGLADIYSPCTRLTLQKTPNGITAGNLTSQIPGRVRIRHPLLQRNSVLGRRVEQGLAKLAGVETVSASSLTGSVLILFRVGSVTPRKLLAEVERHIIQTDDALATLANPPVSHWVAAGTCLGLAGATIVQPALAPVTAAALVLSNVPTLSRGIVELCTWRWKVSSLYTVIMGTTLVSGQFLAAAIMQASITGWHAWTNHRLRKVIHELSVVSESQVSTPCDNQPELSVPGLTLGSLVNVPAGAVLPFDGVVVNGDGDLDEHGVRGLQSPIHRGAGDPVYAGSIVLRGGLQVKVTAVEAKTRLSAIRRNVHSLICEAVGNGAATPRGKEVASRFVPFTFATGTAALLVGDLTTLTAVLRPDFSTGPSLTDRLGTLSSVSHLLHEGWLVRNCETLDSLASIQTIVIAQASSEPNESSLDVRVQRLQGVPRTIELQTLTANIEDCLDHVRTLSRSGRRVAVVGDHRLLSKFAEDSVVRISLTPEVCLGRSHADLIALHAEPQRLSDLLHVLEETRRPARTAWTAIVACNALAITGAFLAGLTSLHVIALTNAGVLTAGVLYERQVRRSKRLLSTHSLNLPPTSPEHLEVVSPGQEHLDPDLENPALQPVVPRHGPMQASRSSEKRFQTGASRQTSRSPKSERSLPNST